MKLQDRIALVTGGSRGIGRAICLALAAEGAAVAVNYRSGEAQAQEVAREIEAGGGRAAAIGGDVSDYNQAQQVVQRAAEALGGLHILVNNAGVARTGRLHELSEADWDLVMNVNVKGIFLCSRAAAPHLANGGAIVNVASLAGRSSSPAMACAYSASKAAVLGLTRHLAKELGPQRTRVCAVNPGVVRTDMVTTNYQAGRMMELAESTPLGRIIEPEEVAAAVVFLASKEAGYLLGEVIEVNGGLLMD